MVVKGRNTRAKTNQKRCFLSGVFLLFFCCFCYNALVIDFDGLRS